jgi:triacylglycerol lipase
MKYLHLKSHISYRFYFATFFLLISILSPIANLDASIAAGSSPLQNSAGLTPHFRSWLAANGYSGYDFARDDVAGGSYGGKQSDADAVINQPVIFIHGNSDSALGTGAPFTGWTASINYFLSRGYKTSELYATTWGPADPAMAIYQYHSKAYLTKIRHSYRQSRLIREPRRLM